MSTGLLEFLAFLEMLSQGQQQGPSPPLVTPPPRPMPPPGVLPSPMPPPSIIPPGVIPPGVLPPPIIPSPGDVVVPIPPGPVIPAVLPTVVPPSAPVPVEPPSAPGVLPPMPPWPPGPVPGTLPPFPGPGWVPDTPVTPTVSARAAYWNPQLWDYPSKTIRHAMVQEQFGGQWLTFAAAWHPGTDGPQTYMATEAWRLASAAPVAPPSPLPAPAPAPMPPPGVRPAPVSPYPGPGAYASNSAYIKRYQDALTFLSRTSGNPALDPKGVDGKYGPNTAAAVKAFQSSHGLTVDGQAGAQTAAALDAAMGYGAVAPPIPIVPSVPVPTPGPAPVPTVVIPAPTPLTSLPAPVSPYPGPGAYQSNAAYITRYQKALTYLAHALSNPALDPQGVDGKYGPHTAAAVKAFQSSHGLTADGQAGAQTAASLDATIHALAAA